VLALGGWGLELSIIERPYLGFRVWGVFLDFGVCSRVTMFVHDVDVNIQKPLTPAEYIHVYIYMYT